MYLKWLCILIGLAVVYKKKLMSEDGTTARRSRSWVFTDYAVGDDRRDSLLALVPNSAAYIVFQEESCPRTQRRHYQGYVQFVGRKTLRSAKSVLGGQPHLATRRGTHREAIAYCKKDESRVAGPWEAGEGVEQGERTDLLQAKALIESGATELAVAQAAFEVWVKHDRALRRYAALLAAEKPRLRNPPEVILLVGPTGCGKSTTIRREMAADGRRSYWLSRSGAGDSAPQYWDGYNGQPLVAIDEFTGWLPITFMLRLLDCNPFDVNCRGYQAPFVGERIWIASNIPPESWYASCDGELHRALMRRITRRVNFFPATPPAYVPAIRQ